MPRAITPATSLDNLKKEAKRWLRQLRDGDDDAQARFESAHPTHAADPVLRDVQHALAREYGHDSWASLKQALQSQAPANGTIGRRLRSSGGRHGPGVRLA